MASAFPRHPLSFNPSFIFWLRPPLSSCPDPLSLWQPSLLGAFALLGLDQRAVLVIPLPEEQASPPSWALGQVAPPASPFQVAFLNFLPSSICSRLTNHQVERCLRYARTCCTVEAMVDLLFFERGP